MTQKNIPDFTHQSKQDHSPKTEQTNVLNRLLGGELTTDSYRLMDGMCDALGIKYESDYNHFI